MEEQKKEEGTDKKEILFFHGTTNFGCECTKNHRFTLAADCNATSMKIAISVCSNTDQFSKAKGREVALARLNDVHNSKGSILILKTTPKGQERKSFNTFAMILQALNKHQLIEMFNLVKE